MCQTKRICKTYFEKGCVLYVSRNRTTNTFLQVWNVYKGSIIFIEHISNNCLSWLKDLHRICTPSVLRHFTWQEKKSLKLGGNGEDKFFNWSAVKDITDTGTVFFAGGSQEASVLVYMGDLGGVACPGTPRSADSVESHCRGIFSHRGWVLLLYTQLNSPEQPENLFQCLWFFASCQRGIFGQV